MTYTANGVANTARFVYDSFGEPRGFILNDSATYLYLKNGQGDICAIIDENGEILVRYEYNAWGAVEFTVPFGVDPAVTSILATVSPFTYRGYCYDYDIGMYYLQSRYYDPQICRFINADSTDYLGATGTVLSYNLFAYCENDGVNRVDFNGNYPYYIYNNIYRVDDTRGFITTQIMAGKKSIVVSYWIVDNILTISNAAEMKTIVKWKWLEPLAYSMISTSRYINPKSLKGRTQKGIQFELLIHYILYIGLVDRKRTKVEEGHFKSARFTDIGATTKKHIGYDYNAKKFEKYSYLYPVFLNKLFQKKQTAYSLYKLAVKLGVIP